MKRRHLTHGRGTLVLLELCWQLYDPNGHSLVCGLFEQPNGYEVRCNFGAWLRRTQMVDSLPEARLLAETWADEFLKHGWVGTLAELVKPRLTDTRHRLEA